VLRSIVSGSIGWAVRMRRLMSLPALPRPLGLKRTSPYLRYDVWIFEVGNQVRRIELGEPYCNMRAPEKLVAWFMVVVGKSAMMAMISRWSLAHDSWSYDVGA